MDMIEILGALVVGGVTGAIAKDKLIGNPQLQAKIRELEGIYKENNNLREDKKKLSRQVEDLLSELKKIRQASQDNEDDKDDMEDDLMKARMELKKLKRENEEYDRVDSLIGRRHYSSCYWFLSGTTERYCSHCGG